MLMGNKSYYCQRHKLGATLNFLYKEPAWRNSIALPNSLRLWVGKACIRGMRVTVGMVVGQIGAGHTVEEILADYPYLEREDIMQALRYAAWRSEEREVLLATA
jgi:uncharacterized protein (DUF433 family)